MGALGMSVLSTNVQDNATLKKIGDWGQTLIDLSADGATHLYLEINSYVMSHASEVEAKKCAVIQ
jgi:hypothetical protein